MKQEIDYPNYVLIWMSAVLLAILFGYGLGLDVATTIAVAFAAVIFATFIFNLLSNGSIYKNVYRERREKDNPAGWEDDYRGFQ